MIEKEHRSAKGRQLFMVGLIFVVVFSSFNSKVCGNSKDSGQFNYLAVTLLHGTIYLGPRTLALKAAPDSCMLYLSSPIQHGSTGQYSTI